MATTIVITDWSTQTAIATADAKRTLYFDICREGMPAHVKVGLLSYFLDHFDDCDGDDDGDDLV